MDEILYRGRSDLRGQCGEREGLRVELSSGIPKKGQKGTTELVVCILFWRRQHDPRKERLKQGAGEREKCVCVLVGQDFKQEASHSAARLVKSG